MNLAKPHVTTALLARRARALKRHLRSAIEGDGIGVHQARVASRRLREAVPVLATGLKGSRAGKARRKIRQLTRALGTVREMDVTLALLDEMTQRETFPRLAIEVVRGRVVSARDTGREQMLKRLEKIKLDKLDRRLDSVSRALEQDEAEGWREALAKRVVKRAKAMKTAIDEAGRMYAPERLHAVRIAVKKLRYAVELAADSGMRAAARLATTLKRAQEALGQLHDLQVLQTHVAAVQAAHERGASDSGLNMIMGALERKCRHLHGRYVSLIPALLDTAHAARVDVAPQLTRRPARARRPLKMVLVSRSSRPPRLAPAVASDRS